MAGSEYASRDACLYTNGATDVDQGCVDKFFLNLVDLRIVKGAADEAIQTADGVFKI